MYDPIKILPTRLFLTIRHPLLHHHQQSGQTPLRNVTLANQCIAQVNFNSLPNTTSFDENSSSSSPAIDLRREQCIWCCSCCSPPSLHSKLSSSRIPVRSPPLSENNNQRLFVPVNKPTIDNNSNIDHSRRRRFLLYHQLLLDERTRRCRRQSHYYYHLMPPTELCRRDYLLTPPPPYQPKTTNQQQQKLSPTTSVTNQNRLYLMSTSLICLLSPSSTTTSIPVGSSNYQNKASLPLIAKLDIYDRGDQGVSSQSTDQVVPSTTISCPTCELVANSKPPPQRTACRHHHQHHRGQRHYDLLVKRRWSYPNCWLDDDAEPEPMSIDQTITRQTGREESGRETIRSNQQCRSHPVSSSDRHYPIQPITQPTHQSSSPEIGRVETIGSGARQVKNGTDSSPPSQGRSGGDGQGQATKRTSQSSLVNSTTTNQQQPIGSSSSVNKTAVQRQRIVKDPSSQGGGRSGGGTNGTNQQQTTGRRGRNTCCFCWCCCCSCSCTHSPPSSHDSLRVRPGSVSTAPKRPQASTELNSRIESVLADEHVTYEDVCQWGESFEFLMNSACGRKLFREFLHLEFSEENILFWLACESLKDEVNPEVIEEKARIIYEDFISILSPREVSLDSRVREIINGNMIEPTPNTFDEAQTQIYTLMHRDSYPRFLSSPIYRDTINAAASHLMNFDAPDDGNQ